MKKILAVVLSVVIVLCIGGVILSTTVFKNDYKDTEVALEPTSELISELVSDNKNDTESTNTSKKDESSTKDTTKKQDNTTKTSTTKKQNNSTKKETTTTKEKTTKEKTTKEETTKETTTQAPKKREVMVDIYLPNKELKTTNLTVKYKIKGSKEWETFKFDDPDNKFKKLDYKTVTLDGKTIVRCTLGKFKGECTVTCFLDGYDLSDNSATLGEYDDLLELHPYSGIEIMEGEDD